ncbi:MAG TPA: hypothetical protein VMM57_01695 [Bacteroidota bacterium]|nr:hypothetical protein [Bacteroidota bacterium]
MRRTAGAFVLGAVVLIALGFHAKQALSLEGRWFGQYEVASSTVDFEVRFWNDGDRVKGTIDIPHEGIFDAQLAWIMVDSTSIHFELVEKNGSRAFDGQLSENHLAGNYVDDLAEGSFSMSRGGLVAQ